MSNYRGRTGPNFSQYLNDLNTVSPPEYHFSPEETDFSQDLAMFTNTDFTHVDIPPLSEEGAFNFDLSADSTGQDNIGYEDLLADARPPQSYNNIPAMSHDAPQQQQAQFYPTYQAQLPPAPVQDFSAPPEVPQRRATSAPRHAAQVESPVPVDANSDDKTRVAADEDKRRRNTAASARFRVKKKQREQALEKTVKETQERNSKLEAKLTQLEMENKWLKELITEKNGISSKEEIAAAYQKYQRESEERDLKEEPAHVKGVGTS